MNRVSENPETPARTGRASSIYPCMARMIARQNAGRLAGRREVIILPSTTTGSPR